MSLMDLLNSMNGISPVLSGLGILTPLCLYLWPRLSEDARHSTFYGHVASGLVALGLIVMFLGLLLSLYLHRTGTNLVTGVRWDLLLVPWWFGFGNLFATTRFLAFSELRKYPLLRRVWALLSAMALIYVAYLVLSHTVWLIFSGVMAFIIIAIVAFTLFQVLVRRGTEPPPEAGDGDLLDDVAERSKQRLARLTKHLGPSGTDKR